LGNKNTKGITSIQFNHSTDIEEFERNLKINSGSITELEINNHYDKLEKLDVEYCQKIPNLKMLHIKYSGLGDDNIEMILKILKEKKLTYLNLMNNKLTHLGAKLLFDYLAEDDSLEILNLMHNNITEGNNLFDFLKSNYTLCILGITGNQLSLSAQENLLENLSNNHTLNNILLSSDHQQIFQSIQKILVENKEKKPIKLLILLIRREKSTVLSTLPRRLLIYLLKFI
jgi:hypothetical protein